MKAFLLTMLFEREQLTPQGRLQVLEGIFAQLAQRPGEPPRHGHVPVDILEAYGDFNAHIRFLLEAAASRGGDPAHVRRLRRIERELDELPASIMDTLPAGSSENWLLFYRRLIQLHNMLDDAEPDLDAEEYRSLILKMVQMAECVSNASAVKVNAASMFALLLIQVHLHHEDAARQRKPRKKKRKRKTPARTTKKKVPAAPDA